MLQNMFNKILSVQEFRSVNELNEYLSRCKNKSKVIPLDRTFTNPHTQLITSTITYILVEYNSEVSNNE